MKKNKGLIITSIVLLCIVIGLLISLLIVGITNGTPFSFNIGPTALKENKEFTIEEVNKIDINLLSFDITVKPSEDEKIHVLFYSNNKKNPITIALQNNILKVNTTANAFCIGFCFSVDRLEVYLPQNYSNELKIDTKSGNIKNETNLNIVTNLSSISGNIKTNTCNNSNILTTSGNINIDESNTCTLQSVSGNIILQKANTEMHIKTTSGNIKIENANIINNSTLSSVSGDQKVSLASTCQVDAHSVSGNIRVNDDKASSCYIKASSTSGDITIK